MKRAALIAALLSLPGCDSSGSSDYTLYYQALRQGLAAGFGRPPHITKDQAAAIPYASIGYRLNDGPEQLLVLATDSGGEELWTSGAHVVIVTRGGRVVRTVGLAQDVSAVTPQKDQHVLGLAESTRTGVETTRIEDFSGIPVYGVVVKCVAQTKGTETIAILGRGITTRKIDENCRSDVLNWSFTDTYWIDPETALAWRSIQHVGPKDEKIEIEVLRPPG